jgi:hypothetical protein
MGAWTLIVVCVGDRDEAYKALKLMRESKLDIQLLAARYNGLDKHAFATRIGMRSRESFLAEAEQFQKDGDTVGAVRSFLCGGSHQKAVEIGLAACRDLLAGTGPHKASGGVWSVDALGDLLVPLHSVNAAALESPLRFQLLAYCCFYGAQVAISRGYTVIVSALFDSVRAMTIRAGNGFVFPVHPALMKMQEMSLWSDSNFDNATAVKLAEEFLKDTTLHNGQPKAVALAKKILAEGMMAWRVSGPHQSSHCYVICCVVNPSIPARAGTVATSKNLIIPSSSNLPTGHLRRFPAPSLISKKPIHVCSA